MWCILFCLLPLITLSSPARILAVFLIDGYSHAMVFSPIINDLAQRGHNITLITIEKYPILEGSNIRQINFYEEFLRAKAKMPELYENYPPKLLTFEHMKKIVSARHEYIFKSPEVMELFHPSPGSEKFDLVLAEYLMFSTPFFKEVTGAPLIGLANMFLPEPFMHILTGQLTDDKPVKGFLDRMTTWKDHFVQHSLISAVLGFLDEEILKYSLPIKRSAFDIWQEIDLVFYVDIPGILPARSLPRFVIPIGPTHINDSATLTTEMKEYLDESTKGIVLISMGTNTQFHNLPMERQNQFFETIKHLPFNFILKCNDCKDIQDEYKNLSNLIIANWVDQLAVLEHKNTKAFVSHAGYQSTLEAVYHAVPMVVFPYVYDQHINSQQIEINQVGVKLDIVHFKSVDLQSAILRVINEKKFKRNMQERSIAVRNQPMKATDIISFWVDYLAQHKQVNFLHGEPRYMPFYQFFNLDIIVVHFVFIMFLTYFFMRCPFIS